MWTSAAFKVLPTLLPEKSIADLCRHIICFVLQNISKISFPGRAERGGGTNGLQEHDTWIVSFLCGFCMNKGGKTVMK